MEKLFTVPFEYDVESIDNKQSLWVSFFWLLYIYKIDENQDKFGDMVLNLLLGIEQKLIL